jgi:antitoxin ParD1/3/4
MQIAIKPELEQRILNKLQDGKYKNIDDLLAIALQLLEDRDNKERKLLDLREKITAGTEQIRQGKVIDGELVF